MRVMLCMQLPVTKPTNVYLAPPRDGVAGRAPDEAPLLVVVAALADVTCRARSVGARAGMLGGAAVVCKPSIDGVARERRD